MKSLLMLFIFYVSLISPVFALSQYSHSKKAMIVSEEKIATEIGYKILKEGGNAIDAAVATAFALAVTYPRAGNLGGGGFLLYHDAETMNTISLDFREQAPLAASKDMFLDENGNVDTQKAKFSVFSSGTPGTVKGLLTALERYGTMNRKKILSPAHKLAEKGFIVSPEFSKTLKSYHKGLSAFPETRKTFYKSGNKFYEPGERFIQKDLAQTLKRIQKKGSKGFYEGPVANKIVAHMKKHGGLITGEDLKRYQVKERTPIRSRYKNYTLYSMPPPSSGGIQLAQMLNILENFDLSSKSNLERNALMIESMKYSFADRSLHIGDPDFNDVPIKKLLSKKYAKQIAQKIRQHPIQASTQIKPKIIYQQNESSETTHISIIDAKGNIVSLTTTLNFSFGNKQVVEGAGFLMNNEMDDFSSKTGSPNGFGLTGSAKNAIEPRKRMLSSMTPTIIFEKDKPRLILGAPGGSRIITSVLQTVLNVLEYDLDLKTAVDKARLHHQWLPDILLHEKTDRQTLKELKNFGYKLKEARYMGRVQAINIDPKTSIIYGKSDKRSPDGAAIGF